MFGPLGLYGVRAEKAMDFFSDKPADSPQSTLSDKVPRFFSSGAASGPPVGGEARGPQSAHREIHQADPEVPPPAVDPGI